MNMRNYPEEKMENRRQSPQHRNNPQGERPIGSVCQQLSKMPGLYSFIQAALLAAQQDNSSLTAPIHTFTKSHYPYILCFLLLVSWVGKSAWSACLSTTSRYRTNWGNWALGMPIDPWDICPRKIPHSCEYTSSIIWFTKTWQFIT